MLPILLFRRHTIRIHLFLPKRVDIRQQFPLYKWLNSIRAATTVPLLLFDLHGFDQRLYVLGLENDRIFLRIDHFLHMILIHLLIEITRVVEFDDHGFSLLPLSRLLALLGVFGVFEGWRLAVLPIPLLCRLVPPLHFLFALLTGVVRHYNNLLKIIFQELSQMQKK